MIFNKLQFDDIDSKDHGIYITGSAAFNSPSRDVEMVTVPGRNGDLILDNGRYNNIEVTYPAGTFGNTEEDFRDKICNFRNLLASKKGYQRLTDTYNPDEYRMAAFVDAIEVEPVGHNIAGEFDIVFNCKPQRFLTSGETEVTVANNGTITNPTLFDASPLISIEGYGTFKINGFEIKVADDIVGTVRVKNSSSYPFGDASTISIPNIYAVPGDDITIDPYPYCSIVVSSVSDYDIVSATISNVSGYSSIPPQTDVSEPKKCWINIPLAPSSPPMTFHYGTPQTNKEEFDVTLTDSNSNTKTYHIEFSFSYDGERTMQIAYSGAPKDLFFRIAKETVKTHGNIDLVSTATTFGHPTYIDCDIGEVYTIQNGEVESLNRYIDLGSDLPVLNPGNNTITFDNTFTSVKMKPRWWRL